MSDDLFDNQSLPYVRGSDTSEAAAESMVPHVAGIRKRVLDFIDQNGAYGATCYEAEVALKLSHQTASARICELRPSLIRKRGNDQRPTNSGRMAAVYVTIKQGVTP